VIARAEWPTPVCHKHPFLLVIGRAGEVVGEGVREEEVHEMLASVMKSIDEARRAVCRNSGKRFDQD